MCANMESYSEIEWTTKESSIENFDITNGLIGIKRDRFLLLIGYISLKKDDNKTRNVYFFFT
jgi:hypothetical protein